MDYTTDKNFAARLLVMVETKLVTSRHTQRWCDAITAELDEPPSWILDLSVLKYKGDVERVIGEFAYSPAFEELTVGVLDDFHIACLFSRFKRRELSWASFLDEAGRYADAAGATPECEYWFSLLNEVEASEFDRELEKRQTAEVGPLLKEALAEVTNYSWPLLAQCPPSQRDKWRAAHNETGFHLVQRKARELGLGRSMKAFHTMRGFVSGQEEPEGFEPEFRYYAMLRVQGDNRLDFDEISKTLGLEPTRTRRCGEKPGPQSPPAKHDVWMYQPSIEDDEEELHHHIDKLWRLLKPHADYLRKLKSDVRVDVILGYSSNIDHAGVTIPCESLELFIQLQLDVPLNIVVMPDE